MKLQIENIEMAQAITFKSKTIIAYALVTSIFVSSRFLYVINKGAAYAPMVPTVVIC
jgi:hypothetical protein